MIKCKRVGCLASVQDHKWGKIKASGAGWYFQRNGDAWCPNHIPTWVANRRQHKRKQS